jgi:hypothetical protein
MNAGTIVDFLKKDPTVIRSRHWPSSAPMKTCFLMAYADVLEFIEINAK